MPLFHAEGPLTSKVSRAEAEAKLKRNPNFPKEAEFELWEQGGRWLAAWHEAGPPFGAPADTDEEAPGPKSEGPDDTAPEPPDAEGEKGPEDDPEGPEGDEGPPKEKKDKGEKGGDVKLDHEIFDLVQQIAVALGIAGGGPEDSPVPGDDAAPPPPAPPGPPHGGPEGPDQEIKHERALKPGEAPPGTTPVGAPAFSSVADDHPWKKVIGKTASFSVEERISGDTTMASVDAELRRLAHGTGFKVKQIVEGVDDDGHRVAKALISAY